MGRAAMNIGRDWHDAETRALRTSLQEAQAELRAAKTGLAATRLELAECHHRIANHLQLVVSFLRMQENATPPSLSKDNLRAAMARVQAIARLHRQFRKQSSASDLDVGAYITALAEDLSTISGARCTVRAESILLEESLGADIAIAINELVVNAAKYGRSPDGISDIEITCCRDDNRNLCITVRDHGPGVPEHSAKIGRPSHGLSFVHAILAHHKGELLSENDGGTRMTMFIPRH